MTEAARARKDTEMQKHSLIAVAVAILATACTMEPKYVQPAAPVSGAFPASGVYATQPGPANGGARSANGQAAVDIGWRDFFADARLQRLIELALKNNRDLRVSVLNIQQAQAQYRVARASLFPTINAAGSETRTRTPADLALPGEELSTEYSVGLNASWELDFFGRIRSLKDQALDQYLSTAQARKAAEIALVSSVADQYLTLLSDDDLLKVTQDTLNTAQASYNITKLQFETGTGSELDLRQAETVVQQALANQQAQARLRAQAENALVLLVGEPLPDDLPVGKQLGDQDLLTDIPAGLPSDLLSRRPDIVEAEESLLAANANIGAARAAFFPQVSLTGNFGTLSPSLGGLFKPGSAAWSFAPQITLPIFTGGENKANLDLARLQQEVPASLPTERTVPEDAGIFLTIYDHFEAALRGPDAANEEVVRAWLFDRELRGYIRSYAHVQRVVVEEPCAGRKAAVIGITGGDRREEFARARSRHFQSLG